MTVQNIIEMIGEATKLSHDLNRLADKYNFQSSDLDVVNDIVNILDDYIANLRKREVK